mgnify:CR=1 FL=1
MCPSSPRDRNRPRAKTAAGAPTSRAPVSIDLVEVDGLAVGERHALYLEACRALRRAVFIEEQQVPEALEWDGLDGDARHFLAIDSSARIQSAPGALALGAARMRVVEGHAKAERVAVRQDVRTLGIGRFLMLAIEAHARRLGLAVVVLHAQVAAIPFYERLGYRAHGDVFLSAGIDHREMTRILGTAKDRGSPQPGSTTR